MNGNSFLLDTNSIIYAINDNLILPNYRYIVSVITEIELLSFSRLTKHEEQIIKEILANFEVVFINQNIKEKTIQIRKRYNLKLPDSLIVATALENSAKLVTSDKQLLNLDFLEILEVKSIATKR
jgi:predicted nucleic acid-binding protein